MALPVGFDPVHMTMSTGPRVEIPRSYNTTTTTTTTSYNYRASLWRRIDYAIGNFGNWIDSHIGGFVEVSTTILFIAMYIGAIIWVFMAESFWWGVLRAFGAFFLVGIGYYVVTIGIWIVAFILKIIRFCFWNIWTLLITLILIGGLAFYVSSNMPTRASVPTEVEQPIVTTTTYTCTARTLNVRSAPNKTAGILGAITKGTNVEVYDITNGFARIDYNGHTGYVSMQYLREGY